MKRLYIFLLISCMVFFGTINLNKAYGDEESNKEISYLSINLKGYGDSDGRIVINQTRTYINNNATDLEVMDFIPLQAGVFELTDYKIFWIDEGLEVEEDNDKNLRIKGKINKPYAQVIIQQEYLLPLAGRGSNRWGERFVTSIGLYDNISTLPLKQYNIYFGLNQFAKQYDNSHLRIIGKGAGNLLQEKEHYGKIFSSGIPSITWEQSIDVEEDIERMWLHVSYRIPSVNYVYLAFTVIGILILSNILLWIKLIRKKVSDNRETIQKH